MTQSTYTAGPRELLEELAARADALIAEAAELRREVEKMSRVLLTWSVADSEAAAAPVEPALESEGVADPPAQVEPPDARIVASEPEPVRVAMSPPEPGEAAPVSDEDATELHEEAADLNEAARRELVRQAVAQARAELSQEDSGSSVERLMQAWETRVQRQSGPGQELSVLLEQAQPRAALEADQGPAEDEGDEPAAEEEAAASGLALKEAAAKWEAARAEPMTSSIVIEDETTRIPLVRVYDTLARLDCADSASLLNYAPHSVSVGLESQEKMPSAEVLANAVRSVFGGDCEVFTDGLRLAARIVDRRRPVQVRW